MEQLFIALYKKAPEWVLFNIPKNISNKVLHQRNKKVNLWRKGLKTASFIWILDFFIYLLLNLHKVYNSNEYPQYSLL